ncbi:MAG: flagellar protein FliS [Lachnospiraceae bacterium]|nr:flagellar protein FliS [Lachnospiraceae bacterium]
MTKEKIRAFTYRISKANKTEMIAILYDIGIEYLNEAEKSLAKDDKTAFRNDLNRARGAVKELMASVNTETGLGKNFLNIYIYCNSELTKAFLNFDKEHIDNVKEIFTELSEAYNRVCKMDVSGPVMGNTETVYSGLTYNRSLLSNLSSDVSKNRGYLA